MEMGQVGLVHTKTHVMLGGRVEPSRRLTAAEELFRCEYDRMLRLAFLLLGSQEMAEDVVHDSFARVIERWDGLDRPGAYLQTTVVNGCRDVHRSRRRLTRMPVDDRDGSVDDPDYLLDALEVLAPERRVMVVLRYYLQFSVPEIALALGVREGTVKSGLHRSLEILRRELPHG